ncbi:MAG: UDP-N-acetylglucosamine--N-acetylmuramyl-(pentapeptide) pyrophosphoryl-undecaprenol N-acetylglucosamine transferase, partial [Polyangiaceae bacterium]
GHVFPGVAVADALSRMADVRIVFVGTARGIETRAIPARGYDLELLNVEPIKGGGARRAVRGAAIASAATLQALSLVRKIRPRAVLSVGGYAAGPMSLAAAISRVPVALLEANATMGLTNRVLAPFARRVYLATEEGKSRTTRAGAVRTFGMPLRPGFEPSPYRASSSRRLLILGGSQGAAPLNDRMPPAIARAKIAGLAVVHQAGRDRDRQVRESYASAGVENVTVTPFLEDVASEIAKADLIVARAGASSTAEITSVGRVSILVPYPFAADDHQAKNAEALARRGGCIAIRQEAADDVRLAMELERLFENDEKRVKMAESARACGHPRASHDVAEDFAALAGIVTHVPAKTNGAPSRTAEAR